MKRADAVVRMGRTLHVTWAGWRIDLTVDIMPTRDRKLCDTEPPHGDAPQPRAAARAEIRARERRSLVEVVAQSRQSQARGKAQSRVQNQAERSRGRLAILSRHSPQPGACRAEFGGAVCSAQFKVRF